MKRLFASFSLLLLLGIGSEPSSGQEFTAPAAGSAPVSHDLCAPGADDSHDDLALLPQLPPLPPLPAGKWQIEQQRTIPLLRPAAAHHIRAPPATSTP